MIKVLFTIRVKICQLLHLTDKCFSRFTAAYYQDPLAMVKISMRFSLSLVTSKPNVPAKVRERHVKSIWKYSRSAFKCFLIGSWSLHVIKKQFDLLSRMRFRVSTVIKPTTSSDLSLASCPTPAPHTEHQSN